MVETCARRRFSSVEAHRHGFPLAVTSLSTADVKLLLSWRADCTVNPPKLYAYMHKAQQWERIICHPGPRRRGDRLSSRCSFRSHCSKHTHTCKQSAHRHTVLRVFPQSAGRAVSQPLTQRSTVLFTALRHKTVSPSCSQAERTHLSVHKAS